MKVDGSHSVESGTFPPQGREDLDHGADEFLHTSFLNGFSLELKDSRTYLVSKYLK